LPRNKTRPDRWRQREHRDRILVVIDAEETKRQYLEQFRGKSSPTIPHVKIVTKNKDPLTVVNHAKQLDSQHRKTHQNPSTGVWRLVERLSGAGQRS
jgi:uncharacterized protein YnzC (UPF0291/DUF896 family)